MSLIGRNNSGIPRIGITSHGSTAGMLSVPSWTSGVTFITEGSYEQQLAAAFAGTHLESLCELDIDSPPSNQRMSGIICTIGPSCRSVEMIDKMIDAGMNIARMNFSHGSHEYHAETIRNVRAAAAHTPKPVAIALDTKGPEIRTGVMKAGVNAEVELVTGREIIITIDEKYKELCDENIVWVDYAHIVKVVDVGKNIYIDDGLISLNVVEKANYQSSVEFA
jgi:pyruvate kinase